MSSTNNGSQVFTWNYRQEGTSKGFNRVFHKLVPKGIVSGAELAKTTDASITISPFVAVIEDENNDVSIRLETEDNAIVAVSSAKPFVVGRYTWLNVENNYADFKSVAQDELLDTDLIFGKCLYNQSELTGFDYGETTFSKDYYEKIDARYPEFHVMPTITRGWKLLVKGGTAIVGGKQVKINDMETPQFNPATVHPRKDLLVLTRDGTLNIIKGVENGTIPVAPICPSNSIPLAYVTQTILNNSEGIDGTMIENIYDSHVIQSDTTTNQTFEGTTEFTSKESNDVVKFNQPVRFIDTYPSPFGQQTSAVGTKAITANMYNQFNTYNDFTPFVGVTVRVQFVNGFVNASSVPSSTSTTISKDNAPTLSLNDSEAYPITVEGMYAGSGFVNAKATHKLTLVPNPIESTPAYVWEDESAEVVYSVTDSNGAHYEMKRSGRTAQQDELDVSMPVGKALYVQYGGQQSPNLIFNYNKLLVSTWENISSTYEGMFFRVAGGDSASAIVTTNDPFNLVTQSEGLPNMTGGIGAPHSGGGRLGFTSASGAFSFSGGTCRRGNSDTGYGAYEGVNFNAKNGNTTVPLGETDSTKRIYGNSDHVRVYNSAMQIWKRTA